MSELLDKMAPPNGTDLKKFLSVEEPEAVKEEPKSEEKPEEPKAEPKEEPKEAEEQPKAEPEAKPEEKPEEPKEPEQKKEIPFNAKHPRFKRVWKELEESRKELADLKAWREEKERQSTQQTQPTTQKIPQAFIDLFGDNEEAWQKFQQLRELDKIEAREEVKRLYEEQEKAKQAQAQAQQKAIDWAEERFADLSDETGVDLTDTKNTVRNQILDICSQYDLFTQEGLPNIDKAFALHQKLYPQKNEVIEEKRQIAAKTNNKVNSSAKESDVYTPAKIAEIKKRGGVHFFLNS